MTIKRFQLDIDDMRNTIINGDFDIWQRGTSLSSGSGLRFIADRFVNDSTGSTYIPSQQSFVVGQTEVPGEPTFYHRTVVSSVANSANYCNIGQDIENIRSFANETITLSFWAKADAPKNIATEYVQRFGTGGSPSADISIGINTHALTTAWQKFTTTVMIPSISGKTLGTNNDHSLKIHWWFDAGSDNDARTNSLGQQSGTFDIAQIQIEKGTSASTFIKKSIDDEILKCQRYYEKSYNLDVDPGTVNGLGELHVYTNTLTNVSFSGIFKINKRAIPSIVEYSPLTGASGVFNSVIDGDLAVFAVAIGHGAFITNTVSAVSLGSNFLHWTAEAEL